MYDSYIRQLSKILIREDLKHVPQNRVVHHEANFGNEFSFKRLGVRVVVVPANSRSSLPRAESHEEEFVYVIEGNPHFWINGFLFRGEAGDCVAFAAGTGIAHTIINNTAKDVYLFVLSETAKEKNRCYFPLNPEMEEKSKTIWWNDAPEMKLGPHDGVPQIFSTVSLENSVRKDRPYFYKNLSTFKPVPEFRYPGDQETFGESKRVGHGLHLERLAIWHETLKPGRRSSWPHAHSLEEEFVYILKGTPQVWLNGHVYDLKPGDGVAFMPASGIAHTMLNPSKADVEMLVCGEFRVENDRLVYPLHPERNLELSQKGLLWKDHPALDLGPHSGKVDPNGS